jgi:hypothetical protein
MAAGRTPDEDREQTIRDAQGFKVLDEVIDDLAMLIVARGVPMDAGTCHLWEVRVASRLHRLGAAGLVRAITVLLSAEAKDRAEQLLLAISDAEPHDLLDGP